MLLEDHFVKGRKQHKMQAMISSDKIASDNTSHFQLACTPFRNINCFLVFKSHCNSSS